MRKSLSLSLTRVLLNKSKSLWAKNKKEEEENREIDNGAPLQTPASTKKVV
jgi:hypothetical protein